MLGFAPVGGAPLSASFHRGTPRLSAEILERTSVVELLDAGGTFRQFLTDDMGVGSDLLGGFAVYGELLDALEVIAVTDGRRGYYAAATDDITVAEQVAARRRAVIAVIDSIQTLSFAEVFRASNGVVTETMTAEDVLKALYGIVIVERLRIAPTARGNQIAQLTLTETFRLLDTLRQTIPVDLIDGVTISQTQTITQAVHIMERLRLASSMQSSARYNLSIVDTLRLLDKLAHFYGADIVDGAVFDSALIAQALAHAGVVEAVEVEAVLTPQLLLNVTMRENMSVSAEQLVRMLYHPVLRENMEISAGYVGPDGSLTTWVMNTRTAAVTEYDDYAFNSFAQIGNRYVGASETGLYELLGDDDDGDLIISRIRSGFMQFGGTKLSRLKAAYIAARGEGDFILKVETAEGVTYNYAVATRNMRSTKVHMGKGQRSRYFAFELISAGQDFDLDTLEFVPIVVQRRV